MGSARALRQAHSYSNNNKESSADENQMRFSITGFSGAGFRL
jgi:hypothetical protein